MKLPKMDVKSIGQALVPIGLFLLGQALTSAGQDIQMREAIKEEVETQLKEREK